MRRGKDCEQGRHREDEERSQGGVLKQLGLRSHGLFLHPSGGELRSGGRQSGFPIWEKRYLRSFLPGYESSTRWIRLRAEPMRATLSSKTANRMQRFTANSQFLRVLKRTAHVHHEADRMPNAGLFGTMRGWV